MPLQRPLLHQVTAQDIAPLEAAFPAKWPEVWKDLARSFYITLTKQTPMPGADPVETAVALVHGVAKDLGGTQPYIPVGVSPKAEARNQRALQLLAEGKTRAQVAEQCGMRINQLRKLATKSDRTTCHTASSPR